MVEDELHLRLTLALILRQAGFRVTAAEDGSTALQKIREIEKKSEKVDLLVTDIQMPGISGLQVIDEIKKMGLDYPSLVITGYGNKDTVIELMRKGCSEYLDKPFEPEEFLKRVHVVLEKQELKKAEREKQVTKIEAEKSEIKRSEENYKQNFERLRQQIDLAVGAYRDLVEIKPDSYKVPIAYRFKPLSDLGGDFVDVKDRPAGCDILVADVAGHDMGASYHAVLVKVLFDEYCRNGNNGQSFFQNLNLHLIEHGKHKRMVTAIFLRLDIERMKAEMITAGHPPLILIGPEQVKPELLATKGDVLGIFAEAVFFRRSFDIKPGQRFFLYTDGITNACRVDGPTGLKTKLTQSGLDSLLEKYRTLPLTRMIEHIWQDVFSFCRCKFRDDMLLLAAEIPVGGSRRLPR